LVMNRILIVYYSQSGEAARVAETLAGTFEAAGMTMTLEAVHPVSPYPYPWKSPRLFFDAMPECILGPPPPVRPVGVDPTQLFDLVVIVYPVWFLSPAPPIQGFFETPAATVLRDVDVMTISVSRAMWHSASERMKHLLMKAGARHRYSTAVTHQGSPLLTLISTPRALLSGKRNRLMGVFPPVGIAETELERLRGLGAEVAAQLKAGRPAGASATNAMPAPAIRRWLVVPELLAWYCFRAWARFIVWLGAIDRRLRAIGVYGFAIFLVGLILIGLPVVVLGTWVLYPLIRHRLVGYINRVAATAALPDAHQSP